MSEQDGARRYLDILESMNPSPEVMEVIKRERDRLNGVTPLDPWSAAGVGPPTPRRSITMQNVSILKLALGILGGALLLCLGGIIYLAGANPARAIPDVLVATTGLVSGGIVGILVPTKSGARNELGQISPERALVIAALVLLVLILFFWLVPIR